MRKCSTCGDNEGIGEKELRPYGKGGALICYTCGMNDRVTTDNEFYRRLKAAGSTVVLTSDGPKPAAKA